MNYSDILFVSDIDNTLTTEGKLSIENERAIRTFCEKGGRFTVATGRTLPYIKENYGARLSINAPVITVNGSLVREYDGRILWKRALRVSAEEISAFAARCVSPKNIFAYTENLSAEYTPDNFKDCEILKMLIGTETEQEAVYLTKMLNERFGAECFAMRSWKTGVEILDRTAGKDVCLQYVKKCVGAKICVAIGDYENDILMLRAADVSIAVGNAHEEVKRCADLVTADAANNAVAQVLESIKDICEKSKSNY